MNNPPKIAFFLGCCLIACITLPASFKILYRAVITAPFTENTAHNQKFFDKYFSNNLSEITAIDNPKATKKLALSLDLSSRLRVLDTLQDAYPFDGYLMVSKAEKLVREEDYIGALNALRASYMISRCHRAVMSYRIYLKDQYNLYLAHDIGQDQKGLKNNSC